MSPLSIAVISDIHIGKEACTPELRSVPASGHSEFLNQFERFVSEQKLSPSYLLLPGDFGETASPQEFDSASTLISAIASILKIDETNIFGTPGNHDVDWHVLEGKYPFHSVRMNQRYDSIRNPNNILSKVFSAAAGDLFAPPHYATWETPDLFCLAYNSTWNDGPGISHSGNIDMDDLSVMRMALEKQSIVSSSKLKICLIHHHIFQHAQFFQEDTSIAQNADELFDLLNQFKFDLLVHGHRHIPKFQVFRKNALHPLAVLGAGTFSRTIESNYTGLAANQFHIIDIRGRNPNDEIFGKVRSWAYLRATGWMPSIQEAGSDPARRRGHGIAHIKPFGGYASEKELIHFLRAKITKPLRTESIIELTRLVKHDQQFDYTSDELVEAALKTLGSEIGFTSIHAATVPNTIMLRKDK